jgi:Flp pilus assembly protein TadG
MMTLGTTFLLGILGLVIDAGYGYYIKQVAQAAADSGALAAGTAINNSISPSIDQTTTTSCPANPTNDSFAGIACLYAQTNGFGATNNQSVAVTIGKGAAAGVSNNYWVSVTATQDFPLSFLHMLGYSTATVRASATSGVIGSGPSGGCIYVLDASKSGAFTASGGQSLVRSDCGIYVNSSSTSALTVSGGATVTASGVNVVGSSNINGGSTVTPSPTNGASVTPDPLASLAAPSVGNCDYTSVKISTKVSLSPGVYCNGITINAGGDVTLASGNYILNGGGLTISGASSVNGSGVFFYNTASGYSFAPLTMSGGTATINLSAPTSGTYEGILFFGDRNITSASKNAITGGTNVTLSGSVYVPSQQLVFSGGSTTNPMTLALIADTLEVSGGSYLKKDATGQLTGIGASHAMLIQ